MAVYFSDYTKNYWVIYFKKVYELNFNKTIIFKAEQWKEYYILFKK